MSCPCRKKIPPRIHDDKRAVYLDNSATTPVDPRVIGAMDRVLRRNWANPSSLHGPGVKAFQEIQKSREICAQFCGKPVDELFFTHGSTDGLHRFIRTFSNNPSKYHLFWPDTAHMALRYPLRKSQYWNYRKEKSTSFTELPVDKLGVIQVSLVEKMMINSKIPVLLYSPVNHETGIVQNSKRIYEQIQSLNGIVIIDGAQCAARLAPESWIPYCDGFALSGHKIYGPKGIGLVWQNRNLMNRIRMSADLQNGMLFPGTIPVELIVGLARAIDLLGKEGEQERQWMMTLVKEAARIFNGSKICFNSGLNNEVVPYSAPGMMNFSIPGIMNMEKLLLYLDRKGISVSRFSACRSSFSGASRILLRMGVPAKLAETSLRISLGRFNKREDLIILAKALNVYSEK